ncbi:ROK family protein [Nitratifractor salsuginis]|uniref:ROK family protein n=1 Tax=Nitratifractor salsuginis (strain DSM 16511 / JCM 12458 / E9I37-1) TaxID=749222 RepID=E6X3G9_NITSE|nr:ROK family protein [Nitratifractor salsuginis]ADV46246.1 ROK family protein [Nitratifractor salsuginis DSM 16511]
MNLAVDLGGTWLRWEIPGKDRGRVASAEVDPTGYLRRLIEEYGIEKVAISFAGQVHENHILSAPNIAEGFDPAALGIPYRIENDLKCAALAEGRYWGSESLVALYSGTGLGSAALEKGKLIRGAHNLAGEIGHVPYRKAPFRCGCGKDNCLELYASGSGIEKWAKHLHIEASLDHPEIHALYSEALLHASATELTLLNQELLVLGGGVITHRPALVEYLKERLPDYAPSFALEGCRIELTRLENASLEGAKILLERFV